MPRTLLWTLYALLVAIWSSTWVAIKIGLEDLAPLLPFGALVFGALLYNETITLPALAGAALVATGLLVAQSRIRLRPRAGAVR
jgi:drug/metabolite transporter (DMT)-like permease